MTDLSEQLRKFVMAGIGAVSVAAEKGQEVLEDLSKRGEEAVAQGKVVNEQLKHDLKQAVKENVTVVETKLDKDSVLGTLDTLSAEERKEVLEKLRQLEPKQE